MKRVLVVDDAKFMQMVLTKALTTNGYEVVGYGSNGLEGFEQYKVLKPDLVTMDITMPDVSGIEGLKMIIDFDSEAKVVMCSAMGQQTLVIESLKYGASDFLVKPFNNESLVGMLKNIE